MGTAIEADTHAPTAPLVEAERSTAVRWAGRLFLVSIAAAIGLRWLYLTQPWRIDWITWPMFLGDEGASGLMGVHILGGERPIFYYGGFYHGALDSYVTAVLFSKFGVSLETLRLTPVLFALATIPVSYLIARRLFGPGAGLLAAALTALPSKAVFEWGTLALCAYCSYAFLVLLSVWATLLILERPTVPRLVLLGVSAGLGIWSNQLTLSVIALSGVALALWTQFGRREILVVALGLLVGLAPLIYGNVEHPFATARQLGRKAKFAWTLTKTRVVDEEGADNDTDERPRTYFSISLFEVLGIQPGRDGRVSPLGTAAAATLILGALAVGVRALQIRRSDPLRSRRFSYLLATVCVAAAVGIGGFAGQPLVRYQLPVYPLLAILAAGGISWWIPRWATVIVALVIAAQALALLWPVPREAFEVRQSLVQALQQRGLRTGVSAGPMYEIIFRSGENVILAPLDHSRYAPYEQRVRNAAQVFYLYRTDQETKPAHRATLAYLADHGAQYKRLDIGDHHVLYDFVPPDALAGNAVEEIRESFRRH